MSCRKSLAFALAATALSAFASTNASAATVAYSSESSFTSVLGGHAYDEFSDLTYNGNASSVPSITRANATYGNARYTSYNPYYAEASEIFRYTNAIGPDFVRSTLIVTFANQTLTAVGGNFKAVEISNPTVLASAQMGVLFKHNNTVLADIKFTAGTAFTGITSDQSITSMEYYFVNKFMGNNDYHIGLLDNLYYGLSAPVTSAAVPLPTASALTSLPAAFLLLRRRPQSSIR